MSAFILRSPVAVQNDLGFARRDVLLDGDGDGVRFIADFGFPWSYPGGPMASRPAPAPPLDNAVVYDIAERANGRIEVRIPNDIGFSDEGLDFTPSLGRSNYLEIPSSVAANLAASQNYLICLYATLPTAANWSTIAARGNFLSSFVTSTTTEANLVDICQFGQNEIRTYRQTAIGAEETPLRVVVANETAGGLAQIAYWRNQQGQGLRVRSVNEVVQSAAARGANNSADFGSKPIQAGLTNTGWSIASGAWNGKHADAHKWKLHRTFIENLQMSQRDPIAVLDADWTRVLARGAF